MKRFISVIALLTAVIAVFCTVGSATSDEAAQAVAGAEIVQETFLSGSKPSPVSGRPEFVLVAENDFLELYIIESGEYTGEFCVVSKSDGCKWYSNPQSRLTNTEDGGIGKNEAFSQLTFTIYDGATKTEDKLNTYIGTNRGERVQIERINGGVEILYIFDSAKIAVPLKITLNGKYLKAEVETEKIIEQGETHIVSMSLLPYFGCTDMSGDGFMLVPDGSGALIYNNNGKDQSESYRQPVYGNDPSYRMDSKDAFTEQAYLPVFGGDNSSGAFLAVIENGAADSYVRAYVSGMQNSYNNVFAEFTLHAKDTVVIGDPNSSRSVSDVRYDFDSMLSDLCTVSYSFLKPGAGYTGMAELYRGYLDISDDENISEKPTLFLELYGGIKKQESFLGLPVKRLQKLTTVLQAQEIVKEFKENINGSINVSYRCLDAAVLNEKAQNKFSVQNGLGTKKQLTELKELLGERLYLEYDPFTVTKSGNGYSKYFSSAKRIGRDSVTIPSFKLSTLYADMSVKAINVMSPDKLAELMDKYMSSVYRQGFGIAFCTLPHMLYTDFNTKNFVSRSDMQKMLETVFENSAAKSMIDSPNAYLFDSNSVFSGVPVSSSSYDIEDASVPFYQLVISGAKEYSVKSVNLSDNSRIQFLKAAETGASLQFSFVYQNTSVLRDTRISSLYGADYSIWKSQAEEMQLELEEIYESIGSRIFTGSRILRKGVYCSDFENGGALIVNYTDEAVETEYGIVEAVGYLVI